VRLALLDPFVLLHRINENGSGNIAPLLAYLRELQRRPGIAVMIVHRAQKGGVHGTQWSLAARCWPFSAC
jgi:hypothetical protein